MDRFIVILHPTVLVQLQNLKSNMDRFIAKKAWDTRRRGLDLKSNMDRFIDNDICRINYLLLI